MAEVVETGMSAWLQSYSHRVWRKRIPTQSQSHQKCNLARLVCSEESPSLRGDRPGSSRDRPGSASRSTSSSRGTNLSLKSCLRPTTLIGNEERRRLG